MHINGVTGNGVAPCYHGERASSPAKERNCECGGKGEIVVGYAFMAKKMGSMSKIVQATDVAKQEQEEGPRVVFKALDLDVPLEKQVRAVGRRPVPPVSPMPQPSPADKLRVASHWVLSAE